MTGAWSVCVQLGARVMAGAIVICSYQEEIGKLNILRESDFHLIPWVDVDYLGATLGLNWKKC